jgi:hypothetical protein
VRDLLLFLSQVHRHSQYNRLRVNRVENASEQKKHPRRMRRGCRKNYSIYQNQTVLTLSVLPKLSGSVQMPSVLKAKL